MIPAKKSVGVTQSRYRAIQLQAACLLNVQGFPNAGIAALVDAFGNCNGLFFTHTDWIKTTAPVYATCIRTSLGDFYEGLIVFERQRTVDQIDNFIAELAGVIVVANEASHTSISVGSSENGSIAAVSGRGFNNMSDSLMSFQPAIDEPSNITPSANNSASTALT